MLNSAGKGATILNWSVYTLLGGLPAQLALINYEIISKRKRKYIRDNIWTIDRKSLKEVG
jgi:hypothetical protein